MDLFTLTAKLVLDNKDFNADIKDSEEKGEQFGNKLSTSIDKVKNVLTASAIGVGVAKLGKAFMGAVKDTTEYADAVDKGAQKIGISYKAYQQWDYALGMSGASVNDLAIGVKNLNAIMTGNATDDMAAAFEKLGVNTTNANGDLRTTEEVMNDVLAAFAGMEEGAERANLVNTLFGRNGAVLNAFFNAGREGVQDLIDEASQYGLIMSDEAIKQGVQTKDAMDRLNQVLQALVYDIMTPLLPLVKNAVDVITWVLNALRSIFHLGGDGSPGFKTELDTSGVTNIEEAKEALHMMQSNLNTYEQLYGPDYVQAEMARLQAIVDAAGGDIDDMGDQSANTAKAAKSAASAMYDAAAAAREQAQAEQAMADALAALGVHGYNAKGAWDIPYDMTTRVHANEMILNATQARQYREGNTFGGVSAMVAALQGLRQDMQNIQLVVGEKALGRATVQYGGSRMNGYIGRSERRVAAGYGWG